MSRKERNEKEIEEQIQRESNDIAAETEMVGETPTQRKIGYVNESE